VNLDFLWQNVVWVVVGVVAARAWTFLRTRVRHRRLRRFFGRDALGDAGVTVTAPILIPLTTDPFDPSPDRTVGLKASRTGATRKWPIYGRVMHLDDYTAAEEILALLREQGATRYSVVPDSDSLGRWETTPCVVCIGSPFVNATFSELITLAVGPEGPLITADRASDTLDSYRVRLGGVTPMTLGVDDANAIGVITRLHNPVMPEDAAVGVWGCRAESTLATARYLKRHFNGVVSCVEHGKPLVVLLAVRGEGLNVSDVMLEATDHVLMRDDDLLKLYQRPDGPATPGVLPVAEPAR
jgi:hypothetical protein